MSAQGSPGTPHRFQIPWVRLQKIHRQNLGRVTVGDYGLCTLEPGTIQFFETVIAGTAVPLGADYLAPYMVPYGIAAAASYCVMDEHLEPGDALTGRQAELEWFNPAGLHDRIIGEATIVELDAGHARCHLVARTAHGLPLMDGHTHLTVLRDGRPIPSPLVRRYGRAPDPDPPTIPGHQYLAWVQTPQPAELGHNALITIGLANPTDREVEIVLRLELPFGRGLSIESAPPAKITLTPGAFERVPVVLRADRPHEVNLGRPWPLVVRATAADHTESHTAEIAVPDPRPGRIFYLLTEDCETFDGGPKTGDYGPMAVLGNQNNVMDPEEYRLQMIDKPRRMNEIADRYGAKWTHFWCATQRFAVDWASAQSTTGSWPRLATDLDASIRQGAENHEYAPHIHFDYEPDSQLPPQPRLTYDEETDGILPNDYWDAETNPRHHWHDWDGAGRGISYIKNLGDLGELDSKAGSLWKSQRYLASLQINRRYPVIARTGGFDFGQAAEDQQISTAAYEANALPGNSDARAESGLPARGLYWCDPDDRTREIDSLAEARLAQLGVPRETTFSDAKAENTWFSNAIEAARGAGVRAVHLMTHAMVMKGKPDPLRSLEGGSFDEFERHLDFVTNRYPEVEFATASEALVEYLDYYSPRLSAHVCPGVRAKSEDGALEYVIRLLGEGIRVDDANPATICVTAPPWFDATDVRELRILIEGTVAATATNFKPTGRPSIEVELRTRPADLRLAVHVQADHPAARVDYFTEPPEPKRKPIFEVSVAQPPRFNTNVLALLMNPIAGGDQPVGRRMHPVGAHPFATAFVAAFADPAAGRLPRKIHLRWRTYCPEDIPLRAHPRPLGERKWDVRITHPDGTVIADSVVEIVEGEPAQIPSVSGNGNAALAATQRQISAAECERESIRAAHREYVRAVEKTLTAYRAQKPWTLMLWARKAHAILFGKGPIAFLAWLPKSFGPKAQLETEEPQLPNSPF